MVAELLGKHPEKVIDALGNAAANGSEDPLVHADPVEQATPARSSAISKACRSSPGKEILLV